MTETETKHLTLADAFGMVEVTEGQAIQVLNSLGEANADKDPALMAAVNAAITKLQSGPTEEAEQPEAEPTSESEQPTY